MESNERCYLYSFREVMLRECVPERRLRICRTDALGFSLENAAGIVREVPCKTITAESVFRNADSR